MRVPNPAPTPLKNDGSSLVLAILVGVAAMVIIALMMQTSGLAKKEGRHGKQEDAIAETMNEFNKWDSVMGNSTDAPPPGETEKKPAARKLPMHLTTPPPSPAKPAKEAVPPSRDSEKSDAREQGPQSSAQRRRTEGDVWKSESIPSIGLLGIVTGADISQAGGDVEASDEPIRFFSNEPGPKLTLPKPDLPALDMLEIREKPVAKTEMEHSEPAVGAEADPDLDVALREAAAIREGFSAPSRNAPVNQLSAPLFSHASGNFPPSRFDIELKLANPNPVRVSRLLYAINDGDWQPYDGGAIVVGPNTRVRAFCVSEDRKWGDSPVESREFYSQVVALSPPLIRASAERFDDGPNRRISVGIADPNRNAVSRVEYRFGGSPWQVYREPVSLDGSTYGKGGVRVEARVVGVMGVTGRQASDSVALELLPAKSGGRTFARASEPEDDLELRAVDLAAPEQPHGYKAHPTGAPAGTEWGSLGGVGAGERFLLETFEAYRRYRDGSAAGRSEFFTGQELGILGAATLVPRESGAQGPLSSASGVGVLEAENIDLFESASVPRIP